MAAVAASHSNGIGNGLSESSSPKDKNMNGVKREVKEESESEDDTPWADRLSSEPKEDAKRPVKRELSMSASPEPPKKKKDKKEDKKEKKKDKKKDKKEEKKSKKKKKYSSDEESPYEEESDEDDYVMEKKSKVKKEAKSPAKKVKVEVVEAKPQKAKRKAKEEPASQSPKKKKKAEEEEDVWRWWEEDKKPDGIKWNSLEHKGPLFAPAYEPLPKGVKFLYNGKEVKLSTDAEEIATFYARMLDHEYTSKKVFNDNFFKDWRKSMTKEEKELITDLTKCNFKQIQAHFQEETEKRKAMTKEEKLKIKEEKEAEAKEYGFAIIDGHKQKIGNFRIEPPGLFRGRGDHPKMGCLKKRITPKDVIINCGKGSAVPTPPPGTKWKEVRHDNGVTWLCSWTENVLGNNKYIMLNPSSKIKGEKDFEKFETARKLKGIIGEIRKQYTEDLKNREMRIRQRAVALYFIDKLALRAGNEKDTEEAADTVGCCSLRVEHIKLNDELDGKKYVVEFDFLGKDSIRYYNQVPVEKQVFKNLKMFKENKDPGDDLFDRLDTSTLNAHLRNLMPGLTAKVFRTYNASITLQNQLKELTNAKASVNEKFLSYNRANRQVAILCNHQRAVPKTHEKSMENLETKINDKKKELKEAKDALRSASGKEKEKAEKKVDRIKEQLKRMKIQRTDKDENKQIALGTSKLNYLDPRISIAWCKKYEVPIEKVFNKTQREKFRWAIDMATEDYEF